MDIKSYKLNNLTEEDFDAYEKTIEQISDYFGIKHKKSISKELSKKYADFKARCLRQGYKDNIHRLDLNIEITCNKSSWQDKSEVIWQNTTFVNADMTFLKADQVIDLIKAIDKDAVNALKIAVYLNYGQIFRMQPRKVFEGKEKIEDISELFNKE